MPIKPRGNQSFTISGGELLAIDAVYRDVANGKINVGGIFLSRWYRGMARDITRKTDKTLLTNSIDEIKSSPEIQMVLNRASVTIMQNCVTAAIDQYPEQERGIVTEDLSERIDILRGISDTLAARE